MWEPMSRADLQPGHTQKFRMLFRVVNSHCGWDSAAWTSMNFLNAFWGFHWGPGKCLSSVGSASCLAAPQFLDVIEHLKWLWCFFKQMCLVTKFFSCFSCQTFSSVNRLVSPLSRIDSCCFDTSLQEHVLLLWHKADALRGYTYGYQLELLMCVSVYWLQEALCCVALFYLAVHSTEDEI